MGRVEDGGCTLEDGKNATCQMQKVPLESQKIQGKLFLTPKRGNKATSWSHSSETHEKPDPALRPDLLLEGMLLKYKPGASHTFIARWVQLTYESFSYFPDQGTSRLANTKPLAFVPLKSIEDVVTIESDSKEFRFLFEILLKDPELRGSSRTSFSGSNSSMYFKGSKHSWSFRAVEWFAADKRLLFAAKDRKELNRWMDTVKTALHLSN